jgi:membrane protease YdiL (CAAX protease family)
MTNAPPINGQTSPLRDLLLFALISWPYFLNDLYLIPLTRGGNLALLWGLDVVFFCLIPATTLLVLFRKGYMRPAHIGLGPWPDRTGWMMAIGAALAAHGVMTMNLEPFLHNQICCSACRGYPFPAAGLLKWGTILYAALSAAVLEEIIFRGILINRLRLYIQRPWVIFVIAAAVFALIHWCQGPAKLLSTFLMGLLSILIYLRRGRLSEAMISHLIFNILAFS